MVLSPLHGPTGRGRRGSLPEAGASVAPGDPKRKKPPRAFQRRGGSNAVQIGPGCNPPTLFRQREPCSKPWTRPFPR